MRRNDVEPLTEGRDAVTEPVSTFPSTLRLVPPTVGSGEPPRPAGTSCTPPRMPTQPPGPHEPLSHLNPDLDEVSLPHHRVEAIYSIVFQRLIPRILIPGPSSGWVR